MIALVSRIVLRAATWALDRFYRVSRVGPPIPDGPVLIVANHPNSLMDALVVLKVTGRRVRPLARAPLFDQPIMGHVLRGLGALPVYRRQDDPGQTWRNREVFREVIRALSDGEAVLLFPEGLSHSEPRLAKIKTGAARIALRAEEAAGWGLGLRVVPVGLTYERKHAFRGRAAAVVGEPVVVSDWREQRATDEWAAVEDMTVALRAALEAVTLNLPTREDRELVEAAERLYRIEKGRVRPRQREALARRLPRLRQFAEGLGWLRASDPARYQRLSASVRTYRTRLALLGVGEGELPERFPMGAVLRYAAVEGALLLVVLPLALAGTLLWAVPYQAPRLSLGLYRPTYEVIATVKLVTSLIAFPLTYALYLALGWWLGGVWALAGLAVGTPVAGLAALYWHDRWDAAREDLRILWRAGRRRRLREALAARRKTLVQEFDRVARDWREERQARRGTTGAAG